MIKLIDRAMEAMILLTGVFVVAGIVFPILLCFFVVIVVAIPMGFIMGCINYSEADSHWMNPKGELPPIPEGCKEMGK